MSNCCEDCVNYKSKPGSWLPYDSRPTHQELIKKGARVALLELRSRLYSEPCELRTMLKEIDNE